VIIMDHVIDGEGRILGRVSSYAAKMLLNGGNVTIVNADKIVISGHLREIVDKYKRRIELKDKANPEHSPYVSRRPDLFVKRVVRGMLPYKQPKGKEAYKRLKVYMGVPEGTARPGANDIKKGDEVYEKIVTIRALAEKLGYRGE